MVSSVNPVNIMYLDFETSGLDPSRHAIIQASWILESDGIIMSERVMDVQPPDSRDLSFMALEVNGFTLERIRRGKSLSYMLSVLRMDLLPLFGNNRSFAFRPCGHNVHFDLDFLRNAMTICNENLMGAINFSRSLDTCGIARWLEFRGDIPLMERHTLEHLCTYFKIPLKAHDALADAKGCRELLGIFRGFREEKP